MRVVLYAEGAWELKGRTGVPPAPGQPIAEDGLGPGHLLVRRILLERGANPSPRVHFHAPLRLRGREARGSDLRHKQSLRQLLSWPSRDLRPDLAVVLVDADGDRQTGVALKDHVAGLPVAPVIAVAVQEFESWLLADHVALARILNRTLEAPPSPESLPRGDAKLRFQQWCRDGGTGDERHIRCQLATTCDLDQVEQRCRSFGAFVRDLRAAAVA